MRTKSGKSSTIWNTTEFEKAITSIQFTYTSGKLSKNIDNALKVEFSNSADFADAETQNLNLVNGTNDYTITPSASYKYVRFTHSCSNSLYFASINIVF